MDKCSRESSCRSVEKFGIDVIWVKLFSCHVCTSSSKIPFLFMEFETKIKLIPKTFNQYNLNELDHTKIPNKILKNI